MHADRTDQVSLVEGSGCQVIVLLLLLPTSTEDLSSR